MQSYNVRRLEYIFMNSFKALARKVVFPSIFKLKLEQFISLNPSRKYIAIMYHGVADSINPALNGRHLLDRQFEQHLIYLKKHFDILPLQELMERRRKNLPAKRKALALTFDDGFSNNYSIAYPLLKKYDIPATFFVLTAGLDDANFVNWPDLFEIISCYSEVACLQLNGYSFKRAGRTFYSEALNSTIGDYYKGLGENREKHLETMKLSCDFNSILSKVPKHYWQLMNCNQIKEVSDSGLIEIGSHTEWHYNLGLISEELVEKELIHSKQKLETITQKPVISLAFPDGSYTNGVKRLAIKCGYKNLIAVTSMENSDAADLTLITRQSISNTTTFESNMIQVHLGFRKPY